jgi:hypothetical protein
MYVGFLKMFLYQADDSRPVHRLSQDVGQVAHDEDDKRLDDPRLAGVLQEEGRQAAHDEAYGLENRIRCDQCYGFKNSFAKKIAENGIFDSQCC